MDDLGTAKQTAQEHQLILGDEHIIGKSSGLFDNRPAKHACLGNNRPTRQEFLDQIALRQTFLLQNMALGHKVPSDG
jgi:hypothetical protein